MVEVRRATHNLFRWFQRKPRAIAVDNVDIDLRALGNLTKMSDLEIRDEYETWTKAIAQRNIKFLEDGVAHEQYLMDEVIDVWHICTQKFTYPALRRLLDDVIPNRMFVNGVDLGCGTVTFFNHLNVDNPILVDLSPDYCSFMANRGWNVLNENIEDLSIDSDSQDVVVCSDILEHVLSFDAAMSEVGRILASDGILLANVPWEQELAEIPIMLGSHIREFNEDNVEKKFAGWDILAREIIAPTVKPNGIQTMNLILTRSDVG